MKPVSIIIPCRNEEKTIDYLLHAILQQTYPLDQMEVVIADGMSSDNTRRIIFAFQETHPELAIHVVDNPKMHIPSALNLALKAAKGFYIVRLDAHSVPKPDYIEKCVNWLELGKAENVGGIWIIKPSAASWIARSIAAAASNPIGVGNAQYRYSNKAAYVDTIPFGAYRHDLFDQIGGFNENLLSNEDYEFNERIRRAGGKVWLDPEIQCEYYARPNLSSLAKQYWRYGFWKFQMLKHFPTSIKWRQLLPPTFIIGLFGLMVASVFFYLAKYLLGIIIFLYLAVLLIASLPMVTKEKYPPYLAGIPLSIMTMHFSWGAGFLSSLLRSLFRK